MRSCSCSCKWLARVCYCASDRTSSVKNLYYLFLELSSTQQEKQNHFKFHFLCAHGHGKNHCGASCSNRALHGTLMNCISWASFNHQNVLSTWRTVSDSNKERRDMYNNVRNWATDVNTIVYFIRRMVLVFMYQNAWERQWLVQIINKKTTTK